MARLCHAFLLLTSAPCCGCVPSYLFSRQALDCSSRVCLLLTALPPAFLD